jgi:hypothetical protein
MGCAMAFLLHAMRRFSAQRAWFEFFDWTHSWLALANDPQLLLLDEATGDLDTRTTVLILLPPPPLHLTSFDDPGWNYESFARNQSWSENNLYHGMHVPIHSRMLLSMLLLASCGWFSP